MNRREFITLVGSAAAAWPLAARAQQPAKLVRIGYLGFGTASAWSTRVEAVRAGLRDLGYVEGKNIIIEFRWAETIDQLREFAAELVRSACIPVTLEIITSSGEDSCCYGHGEIVDAVD